MERNDQMTPEQSMEIIREMITRSRKTFHRSSFYFLLWGVLLAIAVLAHYMFMPIYESPAVNYVWAVVGVIGGIISTIYGYMEGKKQEAHSAEDRTPIYVWGGFVITLLLLLSGTLPNGINPTPLILLLTGLATFIGGGIMRFKPLIIGGIVFWVTGMISFYFPSHSTQFFSIAIILGYLIPCFMLKKKEE